MKIFNTEFEVAMRLLILLDCIKVPIDEEKILYLDFITVNAKNYNLSNENLNGDGLYMINELITQRSLNKNSLKTLVLQDLISVNLTNYGFVYFINKDGHNICESMHSDYSAQYKLNAHYVINKIGQWSTQKIKKFTKEMEENKNGIYKD